MKHLRWIALTTLIVGGFAHAELQTVKTDSGIRSSSKDSFVPLFNGKDLSGWWIRNDDERSFLVENDVLVATGKGDGDWLFTDKEYENYIVRFEYRCVSGEGNSGVAMRATKKGSPAFSGMEIQVIRPGWETPYQRTGSLYATVPAGVQADNPFGEWNKVEVLCDGPRIRTTMNGKKLYDIKMTDYTPETTKAIDWQLPLTDRVMKGHIALQNHGDRVEYRNIVIRILPAAEEEEGKEE